AGGVSVPPGGPEAGRPLNGPLAGGDHHIPAHEAGLLEVRVRATGAQAPALAEPPQSLHVEPPSPSARVGALSGGNQQKVLFARWLFNQPHVLLLDEPTRGVDVGARAAIHQLINDLAAEGAAVLMISSELEEVLGLAPRVLV